MMMIVMNSIVILGSYNPDQTEGDRSKKKEKKIVISLKNYNPDQTEGDRSTSTSTGSSSCDTPSGDEEVMVKIMMMM